MDYKRLRNWFIWSWRLKKLMPWCVSLVNPFTKLTKEAKEWADNLSRKVGA